MLHSPLVAFFPSRVNSLFPSETLFYPFGFKPYLHTTIRRGSCYVFLFVLGFSRFASLGRLRQVHPKSPFLSQTKSANCSCTSFYHLTFSPPHLTLFFPFSGVVLLPGPGNRQPPRVLVFDVPTLSMECHRPDTCASGQWRAPFFSDAPFFGLGPKFIFQNSGKKNFAAFFFPHPFLRTLVNHLLNPFQWKQASRIPSLSPFLVVSPPFFFAWHLRLRPDPVFFGRPPPRLFSRFLIPAPHSLNSVTPSPRTPLFSPPVPVPPTQLH